LLPHGVFLKKDRMYRTLLVSTENDICSITINRPDKLNALNDLVMEELNQAIDEVYADPGIRSALITGAGPKAFVAGADIGQFSGLSREQGRALAKKGSEIFLKIEESPKPIVAAVNGFALGGGCELAMSCHFRVAADHARFGQPEVNLGLIPGYGGTQRLTRLVGKGRALELLMSAAVIDAATALAYGLVNYVVAPEELLNKTKSLLAVINSKAPLAVAKCIASVNAAYGECSRGYELELTGFGECFATEDMKEGILAFSEKRKAAFRGK
jgi:enoyl-CoA hydratase